MVYLLFDGDHNNVIFTDVLLFCHPGEKEWRSHELNVSEKTKRMLYLKNKLHVMCGNYVYFEIEAQGGSEVGDEETLSVGDEVSISVERIIADFEPQPAGGGLVRTREEYFVESFGEVFRIMKWSISRAMSYILFVFHIFTAQRPYPASLHSVYYLKEDDLPFLFH
ncbi:hypothetical protein MKW92_052400 [Papaver armeniacum]|nr:hypothetical protein MKW92_052400 [Papaver armeniacum]